MNNNEAPKRTISNIVRKLLKSKDVSIKRASSYIGCTEQSFRNKLSRDSFSIKDLIILCYVCDAKLMIDYCAYTDDYDMDYFELHDYLNEEEFERVKKLQKHYLAEDFLDWSYSLTKVFSKEEIENMTYKEMSELVKKQFNGKVEIIDSSESKEKDKDSKK